MNTQQRPLDPRRPLQADHSSLTASRSDATMMELRRSQAAVADDHVPALDGVRALAILLVLVNHFTALQHPFLPVHSWTVRLAEGGWAGVDIFFVLSGFLITRILVATRDKKGYFVSFYARRTLRIFPLYYATLVFLLTFVPHVAPSLIHDSSRSASNHVWLWTYTSNIQESIAGTWRQLPPLTEHFWSLAVEEQFYLVWPLTVLLAGRRIGVFAAILVVAAPLLRIAMLMSHGSPVAVLTLMPTRVDALAAGSLLGIGGSFAKVNRRMLIAGGVVAVTGLICAFLIDGSASQFGLAMQTGGYSALALCAVIILTSVRSSAGLTRRLFNNRALVYLGQRSYALYVLHPFAQKLMLRTVESMALTGWEGQIAVWAGGIFLSLLLAEASWQVLERHFMALKRFVPRPAAKLVEEADPATFGAAEITV